MEVKTIRRQKITKEDNFNSITKNNKAKIVVPLLLLTLALLFSVTVNDVTAAQGTSNHTVVQSNNTVEDSQTTVQSKFNTTTSKTNKSSNSLNSKNNQTPPDPQIYNGGVPVARGGNPAGYVYPTIAAAIADAISGDTIMLESGAIFNEYGLVINKNLNFNVFNNGYATINGGNLGTIFTINNSVTATLRNLILINGQGTSGGAIRNSGTLTVTNCRFTNNRAQDGGAIYNGGTLTYTDETLGSITIPPNGGTLTVINSTFTNNIATGNGGVIYNGGTINVTSSTFTSVTITKNGGTLTITSSTFTGNSALNGGAINNGATLTITSSTLTDSTITENGGTLNVSNSTFIDNTATGNGGAISNDATIDITNSSTLTSTTITRNGGTVTVTNGAIIGNTALNGGAISNDATFISAGTASARITYTDYIINNVATVTAAFNTIAGNIALNDGGAVYNNAILTVTDNTLTRSTLNNLAVATVTDNALVDNNAVTDGDEIYNFALLTQTGNTFSESSLSNGATVDAMRNWWGSISGPATGDVYNSGTNAIVTVEPFLNYAMNITITASNSAANVGQQFYYTITVTNNGPDAATDVQVLDGIPAGLTLNNYIASQGTYYSASDIWNVETLASGASAVLQLFVTPTASVAGTNVTKNVTLINTNQTDNVTVVVPAAASNVTLIKTASNLTPNVGQQFYYTITATNNGPGTTTSILVTDIIPAGLIFNSYIASQGTYNPTTGIWNIGTLTNGASAVLQLFVTPTTSAAGTTIINTATAAAQNASATVVVPTAASNVILIKTASNLTPNVGQQFYYTITATNNGPGTTTSILVTDIIPAGLIFNSYTASQGTYNPTTGIWNIGTLTNGASAVLQLFVTPTTSAAGTTIINTATAPGQIVSATVVITTPVTNVTLTKTTSNSLPNVGQQFNYTITATNNGPGTTSGILVTDRIPAGLIFNSYTASQGTYNPTTGIWNIGTLTNGASAVLQLFVTPTTSAAGTTIINTATIPGQIVSATVVITAPVTNVTLTKTTSNLTPNVDQLFYYTITATNNGPGTATSVRVTDRIPAGLIFNSYTASQGTYNPTTGIWNIGTLTNGASAVLQLFVTPTTSAAGTTIINTATAPGQIVSATVVITAPVTNVTLTKTASNSLPNVGQQFNYTITATNNGPGTATNVRVTDRIPAGLTYNGYTASQGTYNPTTGIWNIGTLTNGASAVLQLFVTPITTAGTTIINTATAPGQIVSATVVITAPVTNVTLTKTTSNLTPNVGQQFHYTLTMTNNGPGTATNVRVTDRIPAGLTYNGYTASQGTYNPTTGIWNIGTLTNGASAVLQLFVTPTASAAGRTIVNTATSLNQNVSVTVVVPTTPVTNVTLTKTTSNSLPNIGQQFHYTLTVTNNGPGTATNVRVTDRIPAGLTYNGYIASQGTYNPTTGIWNIGTLTNGASAVLQLFVTPTAAIAGTNLMNTATLLNTGQTASVNVKIDSVTPVPVPPVKPNVNAQSVPMQPTGAPVMPLLLGGLLILAGFVNNARKKQ